MPTIEPEKKLRVLIIDNYDSYTFNLFQYFSKTSETVVIRNNQFSYLEFKERVLPYFNAICISPGPGRPEIHDDFGICNDILMDCKLPILGVCLGHQGLGTILKADYSFCDGRKCD
jgi:para-aminobenzoate synthetase